MWLLLICFITKLKKTMHGQWRFIEKHFKWHNYQRTLTEHLWLALQYKTLPNFFLLRENSYIHYVYSLTYFKIGTHYIKGYIIF